jgi:hypothetical protein
MLLRRSSADPSAWRGRSARRVSLLVSCYGTRPARTLGVYGLIVAAASVLMHCFGFEKLHDWVHSVTCVLTASVFVESPDTGRRPAPLRGLAVMQKQVCSASPDLSP